MVRRRWLPPGQGCAADLAALLEPYADPNPGQAGRLLDVPPGVAAAALALLPEDLRVARLNGSQPPMRDLTALAAEFGGRLVGGLMTGRAFVRFDGVQVPAAAARDLAARVAAEWPAATEWPAALESAVAEAWASWTSAWAAWKGVGTDLLTGPLPAGIAVVGLWWD
jgi:hypothetical protein